jgi:hypothetical protein
MFYRGIISYYFSGLLFGITRDFFPRPRPKKLVILDAKHRGSQDFVMKESKIHEILGSASQG